jgi:hypothetical protein
MEATLSGNGWESVGGMAGKTILAGRRRLFQPLFEKSERRMIKTRNPASPAQVTECPKKGAPSRASAFPLADE